MTVVEKVQSKVPQLRFKEFNKGLNRDELCSLGSFLGGGTPDTENDSLWEGDIPWVSSSDIVSDDIHKVMISRRITKGAIKDSATKLIPKEALLFVSRVGVGKLAIAKQELCTSQDFTNFVPSDINPTYVAYFFQSNVNLLKRYSQGTSIKGITSKELGKIPVYYGGDDEQNKISSFFSTIDKKISLLKQKHEQLMQYKKGIMQQLFSQQLRFKDDNGQDFPDWEVKPVSSIMKESRVKGSAGDVARKITVKLWGRGVFEKVGKDGSENTQYYTRTAGQFIYSKLDFLNCALGIVPEELDGLESTVDLPCFDMSEKVNKTFVLEYIKQKRFYKKYGDMADGSRKAKRIHADTFLSFPISLPSGDEQNKIADFLDAIDQKINLAQQKIEQTQTYKQGLLQQMFV